MPNKTDWPGREGSGTSFFSVRRTTARRWSVPATSSTSGSTPFTAPLARLGQLRSAGITDLRFGYVLDEDWHGHDRFHRKPDSRQRVPLPEGVACYAVAATTAAKRSLLADRLIGDGLVPLHSALGHHRDAKRRLDFPKSAQRIAYQTSHMALLSDPQVAAQILRWLRPGGSV